MSTYYVDINTTYETSGIGTSASPFNYMQFLDYFQGATLDSNIVSGCNVPMTDGDIFKLRGYRDANTSYNVGAISLGAFIVMDETTSPGTYTVEEWDNVLYGPPVIADENLYYTLRTEFEDGDITSAQYESVNIRFKDLIFSYYGSNISSNDIVLFSKNNDNRGLIGNLNFQTCIFKSNNKSLQYNLNYCKNVETMFYGCTFATKDRTVAESSTSESIKFFGHAEPTDATIIDGTTLYIMDCVLYWPTLQASRFNTVYIKYNMILNAFTDLTTADLTVWQNNYQTWELPEDRKTYFQLPDTYGETSAINIGYYQSSASLHYTNHLLNATDTNRPLPEIINANSPNGIFGSPRLSFGAFNFGELTQTELGQIGGFYFGDIYELYVAELGTLQISGFEPIFTEGASTEVNVPSSPGSLVLKGYMPLVYTFQNIEWDFTGVPRCGVNPLDVFFTVTRRETGEWINQYTVDNYQWYFDYEDNPLVYETTTSASISHIYNTGHAGKKFDVKLIVNLLSGATSGITYDVLKEDYITICGAPGELRYGSDRFINLTNFLPETLRSEEIWEFTEFFQNFLNDLYDGIHGYTVSATDVYEQEGGVSATSASYHDMTNLDMVANVYPAREKGKISILEKIYRLTELHDPDVIDLDYIQFFASYLGYSVNVSRGELGTTLLTSADCCKSVDDERYLRFMVRNLPHWYKLKTTTNAIKTMLFSFGLVGDIINYYTEDYKYKWKYADLQFNATTELLEENLEKIDDNFYPTPHFAIWFDINRSATNLSFDLQMQTSVIDAINSIRPINTVFEGLHGYFLSIVDCFLTPLRRFRRFFKIESLSADKWV